MLSTRSGRFSTSNGPVESFRHRLGPWRLHGIYLGFATLSRGSLGPIDQVELKARHHPPVRAVRDRQVGPVDSVIALDN